MTPVWISLVCVTVTMAAGSGVAPLLSDPVEMVSHNDTVYDTPSVEPWEAMPVGGGDLSAMVRCDGADIHLHLSKSDAWGFAAPPDAPVGTRYFNNVSPGHVRIQLGEAGKALSGVSFKQRLDLYHGRIKLTLGGKSGMHVTIWGHPEQRMLILEFEEQSKIAGPLLVELSEWRDTMRVAAEKDCVYAQEVQTRPARPHLASAGMQDYFNDENDPLLNRETAVVITAPGISGVKTQVEGKKGWIELPSERPKRFTVVIACEITPKRGALDNAHRSAQAVSPDSVATLAEEHAAWWRNFWAPSFIRLESPGDDARKVTAAYYVHLYTLGCVNRGAVPAKWDGGPGLLRNDDRTWGLAEWIQEIRFTFLPLYAANQLDMAKGLPNHYSAMRPYLREQTQKMWGLDGIWIPETVLPWGGIEDWALKANSAPLLPHFKPWDPVARPYGKFEAYNPYVGFLFTAGLELCWHYMTYARYSGDEEFLRDQAYPMERDVCVFISGLLREGTDERFHLDPANALETWWIAGDPTDTLDGVRAIFPEFIRFSEMYGVDTEARARCGEQLSRLPDSPRGVWNTEGVMDASIDAYAPAIRMGDPPHISNFENPALYRVFPFGLSGIGTPDYERAVRTFDHRICTNVQGWSMDPIWAARLGLRDQACALLMEHYRKWNKYRYGGWDSENSNELPGRLALTPYLDAGGVSAYALQSILLQSHNNAIRIAPALASDWSGAFRLLAEGGFLVTAEVSGATVQRIEITSLLSKPCTLINPWPGECVVRDGNAMIVSTLDRNVRFDTTKDHTYVVEQQH